MEAIPIDPPNECDLVMKGGVTSGVVYPYAILELAKAYRFRSIGGASAGAIAAAFTAAAEYGRQAGDVEAFGRFKARCDQIPEILGRLFRPSPPFERLMNALLAASGPKAGRDRRVLYALRAPLLAGASTGMLLFGLLAALPLGLSWSPGAGVIALLGALISGVFGAASLVGVYIGKVLLTDLARHNFGFCSGLGDRSGGPPALTEWIHESLQEIAFGPQGRAQPITFGDLAKVGLTAAEVAADIKAIELKMMATNLSIGRPHAIPDFGLELLFAPAEWHRLFPADVMTYLTGPASRPYALDPRMRSLPVAADLPVLVGVRMSLSFPLLIEAVPLHMEDLGALARDELPAGAQPPTRPVLFSDGGITSNFPIHFFDALLPTRPTFALSLDEMHAPDLSRVSMPQVASDGAFSPLRDVQGTLGFCRSILGAAKDWQDEMLSVMPGQRQRVVRIRLEPGEGGLNLNMEPDKARKLMGHGADAGRLIRTAFDFQEHRYRRTLVAYEHLRDISTRFAAVWPEYGAWYRAYSQGVTSYKRRVRLPARIEIANQLDAFAPGGQSFQPLPGVVKFPRPAGRLTIVPDV